jgi:hypothetical protein
MRLLLRLLLLSFTLCTAEPQPCTHIAYAPCGPCCVYVQTLPAGTMIVEQTAAAFLVAFAARVGCVPTMRQLNVTYLCDGDYYARVPP